MRDIVGEVTSEDRLLLTTSALAVLALVFFGTLARAVTRGTTALLDTTVRNMIHSWATPILTRALRGVTQLGSPTFLLVLGAVVVWRLLGAGRPRAAVVFAIAALGADACDQALKFYFQRPRPEVFFGLAQPVTYSFPSGHSVESCCFYGVLAAIVSAAFRSRLLKASVWVGAAVLTLAVGFSRIYLGVHYPTDVLGGYLIAVAWAAVVRAAYQFWLRRRPSPSIS